MSIIHSTTDYCAPTCKVVRILVGKPVLSSGTLSKTTEGDSEQSDWSD